MKNYFILFTIQIVWFFLTSILFGQSEKVKITGEYTYTYGDNESLIEAKEICYTMALRNAVESYKTFITSTSTIKDFQLIKDLIQTITGGYLENIQIVKDSVENRTVYMKIETSVSQSTVDNVIKREIKKYEGKEEFEGIVENQYVKILSAKLSPGREHFLRITYQQKKKGGTFGRVYPHHTYYYEVIVIDCFDANVDPIESIRADTEDDLYPNEFRIIEKSIRKETRSFKLWFLEKDHN